MAKKKTVLRKKNQVQKVEFNEFSFTLLGFYKETGLLERSGRLWAVLVSK